jgi:hypothetical protein
MIKAYGDKFEVIRWGQGRILLMDYGVRSWWGGSVVYGENAKYELLS